MSFRKVDPRQTLPQMEEEVLKFWNENKIFEKSLENRQGSSEFSFYDGPPFATGTPHYGHLVASTMKDVVPRYWTIVITSYSIHYTKLYDLSRRCFSSSETESFVISTAPWISLSLEISG